MTQISLPRSLSRDELNGDWAKDIDTVADAVSDLQNQTMTAINGGLTIEDNTTSWSGDYTLTHGVETRIKSPLGVPIKGILAMRCVGLEVGADNKTTRSFYSLGTPRIDWEPADSDGSNVLVTATYPRIVSGAVGQYVSSSIASGSAIGISNNTAKTITAITLGPGDWDVSLIGNLDGTLTGTAFAVAIGQTTDSMTGTITGDTRADTPTVSTSVDDISLVVPPARFVLTAASTLLYYVALAVFSAGTAKAYGRISARRMTETYVISIPRGRVRLFFYGG